MQKISAGKFHFEPPLTVAVGTRISSRAPRTEPYVRLSRIRLPPRVCDGEALIRPRMEDDRFREPAFTSCVICAHVIRSFWLRRVTEDLRTPPFGFAVSQPNASVHA